MSVGRTAILIPSRRNEPSRQLVPVGDCDDLAIVFDDPPTRIVPQISHNLHLGVVHQVQYAATNMGY